MHICICGNSQYAQFAFTQSRTPQARSNPDQYTSVSASLKILKLLVGELAAASGDKELDAAASAAAATMTTKGEDGEEGLCYSRAFRTQNICEEDAGLHRTRTCRVWRLDDVARWKMDQEIARSIEMNEGKCGSHVPTIILYVWKGVWGKEDYDLHGDMPLFAIPANM